MTDFQVGDIRSYGNRSKKRLSKNSKSLFIKNKFKDELVIDGLRCLRCFRNNMYSFLYISDTGVPFLLTSYGFKKLVVTNSRYGSFSFKNKSYMIHRLVAELFVDNIQKHPCVNHKDGNKLNNDYKNLEWCTHSQNSQHSYDVFKRKPPHTKLDEKDIRAILILEDNGVSRSLLCKAYNVSKYVIDDIRRSARGVKIIGETNGIRNK